jgi:aminopeptidase N/puromycin-sensitive aminopeptidase
VGYYRSLYSADEYQRLVGGVESELNPSERIALVGSQWALTLSNKAAIGDFLSLVDAIKGDASEYVVGRAASAIETMNDELVTGQDEHLRFAAWLRTTFGKALRQLGAPSPTEAPSKIELRAELFRLLGGIGNDPEVVAQAQHLTDQYLVDPTSVDPTLALAALEVAAEHGNQTLFDRLQHMSETASDPQLRSRSQMALTYFRDPKLVERALQYAVSGKVKNQDSGWLIVSEIGHPETRDQAWDFVRNQWSSVQAQLTTATASALVGSTGNFCSATRLDEAENFFSAHPVEPTGRALRKAKGRIGECIARRKAQQAPLEEFLRSQVSH